MIKDVIIDIKGVQGIDGQTDTVEFTTEGKFGFKNGKYFLSYDEGQMMEDADVKTKIWINSYDSLVLQRSGTISSRMEIEKGKRNSCFYSTPVGDLCIGIFGETIDVDLGETGGSLNMVYTIDSGLTLVSRNEVRITVKEVQKCQ